MRRLASAAFACSAALWRCASSPTAYAWAASPIARIPCMGCKVSTHLHGGPTSTEDMQDAASNHLECRMGGMRHVTMSACSTPAPCLVGLAGASACQGGIAGHALPLRNLPLLHHPESTSQYWVSITHPNDCYVISCSFANCSGRAPVVLSACTHRMLKKSVLVSAAPSRTACPPRAEANRWWRSSMSRSSARKAGDDGGRAPSASSSSSLGAHRSQRS